VFQVNVDGLRHGVSSKRDGAMLYVLRHETESERRSNNPSCYMCTAKVKNMIEGV
jgi:hypothetical protein